MTRQPSETVDLKVRMREPLRGAIEKAATQGGVSMNAEAVNRLEASFREEELFSSPRMRRWAIAKADQFHKVGVQHVSWPEEPQDQDKWMDDFQALAHASYSLMRSLIRDMAQHRDCDVDTVAIVIDQLRVAAGTELVAAKKLEPPVDSKGRPLVSGFLDPEA